MVFCRDAMHRVSTILPKFGLEFFTTFTKTSTTSHPLTQKPTKRLFILVANRNVYFAYLQGIAGDGIDFI